MVFLPQMGEAMKAWRDGGRVKEECMREPLRE
jgi:hypothetical protein